MSAHTYPAGPVITRISCDADGCLEFEERNAWDEWGTDGSQYRAAQLAAGKGWTAWRGRSMRHYCPEHGPSRGHKMERYTRGAWAL